MAQRLPAIRSRLHRLAWCLLLLLLTLPLTACSDSEARETTNRSESDSKRKDDKADKDSNDEDSQKKTPELVPVEVAALETGKIESVLRFSTNLEAESEVQVFSQAARRVTQLLVEEGQRVRKGQILLRLQDEEQRSNLARVESQLGKARTDHERQKTLFDRELISEQVYNDMSYELDQLELSFADAKRELSYTEVRAPISGTVTNRLVNLGDHITVNQHLFDIVYFDTIVARVYVPEKELGRLRPGQEARVFSSSLGPDARQGEVERIAPIVDPRSGTLKTTIAIPSNQGLRPGMYVETELVTEVRDSALLVPKRALVYDENQVFVYRLRDDMTVERLLVEPQLEDERNIEPTEGSDLAPGDRLVIAGQAGLKSGVKVRLAGDKPSQDAADAEDEA